MKLFVPEELAEPQDADQTLMMLTATKSERGLANYFDRVVGQKEDTRT
jgi:hypothetical protein